MGQVLHGSATTTEAVRRAIQHSQASLRALARRYGINQKTVAKWKKRTSTVDVPTGPKEPKSTVLSVEEEAIIAEALAKGEPVWAHAFEYACATLGIQHRTTKPKHPWTNGQVERMNRTIKEATVKRFHYDDHDQLRGHLTDFISA
jgi:transposase InsO family protein